MRWYGELFTDAGWRGALRPRCSIAALSAALAVAIAFPLAWFMWRRLAPWARVFLVLGLAPFMLPPVITALGFLVVLGDARLLRPAVDRRHLATRSSSSRCRW